jgi:hypothetical protein
MTPRDFCYWLQGTFELGRVNELDAAQVEILRKHLKLLPISRFDRRRFPDAFAGADFCDWLNGLMTGVKPNAGLTPMQVSKIASRLSQTFLHVIDNTFENIDELREVHRGEPEPVRKMLC